MIQTLNDENTDESLVLTSGYLRPLWEAGLTDLHHISSWDGSHLLNLTDLRRKHPDMALTRAHGMAVSRLRTQLNRRGLRGIPTRFRSTIPNPTPSVVELAQWETIPEEVLAQEDRLLREDLAAGDPHPPTHMQADTAGTVHSVSLSQRTHFARGNSGYRTPMHFRRLAPPRPGSQVYTIRELVARRQVTPTERHSNKRGRSQLQYLTIFEDEQGAPYPPEWQAEGPTSEADYQIYVTHTQSISATLHSSREHVGVFASVLAPEPMHPNPDSIACSVCRSPNETMANQIVGCETCVKWYHQNCLTPPLLYIPTDPWHCEACTRHSPPPMDQGGSHKRKIGLVHSNRDPDYKGYPYVVLFPPGECMSPIYTDLKGRSRRRGEASDTDRGIRVQDEIRLIPRVSPPPEAPKPCPPPLHDLSARLTEKLGNGRLHITTVETNPYKDIHPTRDYTLRRVPGTGTVRSYDPAGRWLGEMTERRLRALHTRFEYYWSPANAARRGKKLTWRHFEWEIGDLFKRYKPGATTTKGRKINIRNHWATRDPIREAIIDGYSVTEEMFAPPLNFLIHPSTTYCSIHERDVVFGARYNAYGSQKRGTSIYANPEYEQGELLKTLKWAIMSSQEPEPFSAILVYPRWKMGKFMELLTHHNVRLVAKFTRGSFSFMSPTHWQTGDQDTEGKNTSNWQVLIIEVSNPQGRATPQEGGHKNHNAEANIITAAVRTGAVQSTHTDPSFTRSSTPYRIKPPDGYLKARQGGGLSGQPPPHPSEALDNLTLTDLRGDESVVHAGGKIIYTDGSEIQEQVGAGYVVPATGETVQMKVSGPQTVNRAEMTAILAALEDTPREEDLSTFTDSKCAILNIIKWIRTPHFFDGHKHRDILGAICGILAERTGKTRLYKIPAHVGHQGNEEADATAKEAAKATGGVGARGLDDTHSGDTTYPILGEDRLTTPKKQLRGPVTTWLAERCKFATLLHELWTTGNPDIDPKPSSVFFRPDRPVSQGITMQVFRTRGGDYVCGHLLHLHAKEHNKHTINRHCPLGCRDQFGNPRVDTWLHTVLCQKSGASEMNTTRHNAACRLSDKRIKTGTLGKWLILRNFGRTDDEPEEKTVPDWMLPPGHGIAHNKPDFVIVKGWPTHLPPPTAPIPAGTKSPVDQNVTIKLILGELKYSDDMHTLEKHASAHAIYSGPDKLTGALRGAGWSVDDEIATIVVGHRATVSRRNHQSFEKLGITNKKHRETLHDDLAMSAAVWLRNIIAHTRRFRAKASGAEAPSGRGT